MKYFLFLSLFFFSSVCLAQEPADLILVEAGPSLSADDSQDKDVYCFAGQTIQLPIKINGAANASVDLKGQLYHLASGIGAAVGEPFVISTNKILDAEGFLGYDIAVSLPELKRTSKFQLQLWAKLSSQESESWRPAGKITIKAYPDQVLAPLQEWAQVTDIRLDDPEGRLKEFFELKKIPYLELKAVSLDKRPKVIFLTKPSKAAESRDSVVSEATVIHLREAPEDGSPYIVVHHWAEGAVIDVKMNLLDRLNQDPRAQLALLEIIQLIQNLPKGGQDEKAD